MNSLAISDISSDSQSSPAPQCDQQATMINALEQEKLSGYDQMLGAVTDSVVVQFFQNLLMPSEHQSADMRNLFELLLKANAHPLLADPEAYVRSTIVQGILDTLPRSIFNDDPDRLACAIETTFGEFVANKFGDKYQRPSTWPETAHGGPGVDEQGCLVLEGIAITQIPSRYQAVFSLPYLRVEQETYTSKAPDTIFIQYDPLNTFGLEAQNRSYLGQYKKTQGFIAPEAAASVTAKEMIDPNNIADVERAFKNRSLTSLPNQRLIILPLNITTTLQTVMTAQFRTYELESNSFIGKFFVLLGNVLGIIVIDKIKDLMDSITAQLGGNASKQAKEDFENLIKNSLSKDQLKNDSRGIIARIIDALVADIFQFFDVRLEANVPASGEFPTGVVTISGAPGPGVSAQQNGKLSKDKPVENVQILRELDEDEGDERGRYEVQLRTEFEERPGVA